MRYRVSRVLLFVVLAALSAGLTIGQPRSSNLTGMLGVGYRDFRDGSHSIEYTLHTLDGVDVPLTIPEDVLAEAGGLFALQDTMVEALLGLPARDGSLSAAALYPVAGPRWFNVDPSGTVPWIYLLCKFDDVAATPITFANMQTMAGNSSYGIGAYWSAMSHGTTTTSATVYDWKNIGHNRSYYAGMADSAARAAYVSDCATVHGIWPLPTSYNLAVALNEQMFSSDYAYGGYNFAGGLRRTIYLPDWAIRNHTIIAHEQGHGYGMPHSNNSDGDNYPYDNPWDMMSDGFYEFSPSPFGNVATPSNAYHFHQLGLLPPAFLYTLGANSTATIVIDDWLVSSSNYRAAFIPIPGTSRLYSVEVHKGTDGGFNGDYQPGGTAADVVIVYNIDPARQEVAWLAGGTSDGASYSLASAWTPGEVFEDSANDITIEVLSATADGFTIRLAQGTSLEALTLIDPAPNDVLTDSTPTFEWTEAPSAATYKVKVKRTDSPGTVSFSAASAACTAGNCSATPDLAALGWKWNDNATYKWWVTGKSAGGAKIAKSAKNAFTTDMMPSSIAVTSPAPDATLIGTVLTAKFTGDPRVAEYRAVVKHSGKAIKSVWAPYAVICAVNPCAIALDLTAFAGGATNGTYNFKLLGRNPNSVNKAKAPKRYFSLDN